MKIFPLILIFISTFLSLARAEPKINSERSLQILMEMENRKAGAFDSGDIRDAANALSKQQEIQQNGLSQKEGIEALLTISNKPSVPVEANGAALDPAQTRAFLEKSGEISRYSSEELNETAQALLTQIGNRNLKAAIVGLGKTAGLEKPDFFALPFIEQMRLLAKNLPEVPQSKGFRSEVLGLKPSSSKADVLQALSDLQIMEQKLLSVLVVRKIRELPDLFIMNKTLRNRFEKEISKLKSESVSQNRRTELIELQEMPLEMALLRGCTGGDCSTKKSFPYPNLKTEKVFFVLYNGQLKGYLQWTEVKMGSEKAIYLHTLAGPSISADMTFEIVRLVRQALPNLGYSNLLIPTPGKALSLLNYKVIRSAVIDLASAGSENPISYLDAGAREKLHAYSVESKYDSPEFHPSAILLGGAIADLPAALVRYSMFHQSVAFVPSWRKKILFAMRHFSGDLENPNIANDILGPELSRVTGEYLRKLENSDHVPVQEYLQTTASVLWELGEDDPSGKELSILGRPFLRGLLRCPDFRNIQSLPELALSLQKFSPAVIQKSISYSELEPLLLEAASEGRLLQFGWIPDEYLQTFVIQNSKNGLELSELWKLRNSLLRNTDTVYSRRLTRSFLSLMSQPGWTPAEKLEMARLYVSRIQMHALDFVELVWRQNLWKQDSQVRAVIEAQITKEISQRPKLLTALREAFRHNLKPIQNWLAFNSAVKTGISAAANIVQKRPRQVFQCQKVYRSFE